MNSLKFSYNEFHFSINSAHTIYTIKKVPSHLSKALRMSTWEVKTSNAKFLPIDVMCRLGKWKGDNIPSWIGYMRIMTSSDPYSASQLLLFPIIKIPNISHSNF